MSRQKWHEWFDGTWPDWPDDGRDVEIRLTPRGAIIRGALCYEDFSPGPDEHPYWLVRQSNGETILFVEMERWRFVDVVKPVRSSSEGRAQEGMHQHLSPSTDRK